MPADPEREEPAGEVSPKSDQTDTMIGEPDPHKAAAVSPEQVKAEAEEAVDENG